MTNLPAAAQKYFWGDDLRELNWGNHQNHIIQTLLEKGDLESVHWLLQQIDKQQLFKKLPSYKLSKKSANFWRIYLSA